MFVELAGTALTYKIGKTMVDYIRNRDARKLKLIFNEVMLKSGTKNKDEDGETYTIYKAEKTKYGFFTLIQIPNGLDYAKLESLKDIIQDNMKCLVEFDKDRYSNLVKAKFIYCPQDDKDYAPVKTKSHKIFLGFLVDGTSYKIDLNKDPHILIAGKTGTGKSFLFASVLTNLIYNNAKDIEVYLFQIMKGEIDVFRNCPSVKFTSDNEEEILIVLEKLYKKIHERSKKFAEYGIKNITQWNQHFSKKKMKRIIIGVEEISFFMNRPHAKDEDKEKDPYFKYFTGIVKAGRSVGIHFICLTQRTTAKNLGGDGELKSQMCVITGQQKTKKDSENAIDIGDASSLKIQEYIANSNDGYTWFKAPNIDEDYNVLQSYVKEIVTPNSILEQQEQDVKSKQNKDDNVLICTKSEWIPLEEYNKQKQIEVSNTIKTPLLGQRRKGVIPLTKGGNTSAN